MLTAVAGAEFLASVSGFPTGIAGTVGVQVLDSSGAVATPRTTAGILESPPGSGNYFVTLIAPSPGLFIVFWDAGVVSPSTSTGEPLRVTAAAAPITDPRLAALRLLLEDLAKVEAEVLVTPGQTSEFFVSNPPIVSTPTVNLAGVPLSCPAEFGFSDFSVTLVTAPAAGQKLTIRYRRRTFPDAELERYVAQALEEHDRDVAVLYRAAIYALDSLLVGAASALDFGSGQETFQLSSIHTRLTQTRALWLAEVDAQAHRPRTFAPADA